MLRAALLVAAAVPAGCDVGPDYHRPLLVVPAAFEAQAGHGPAIAAGWWRGFGSPELDQLIEAADLGNLDLAAAAARVVQADQAARIAGAPLLPSLTATASQNWQRTGTGAGGSFSTGSFATTGFTVPSTGHYTESRSYSGEFSASYEVDFWGKIRDQARSAEASALASRYDLETVRLTAITSVANTYFQALGYRDELAIAQSNLHDAQQVLDAIRGRLEVGTASALDISQQEALVAGYRAQLPSLESSYRQEVIALGVLVGEPPERITLDPVPLTTLKLPEVTPGMPANLLRRRPDVANAEGQLIAQNATVKADVADFFPALQLTATGGVSSAMLSTITGPGTLIASLASSLTQTIFDNGLKSGTLGEAKGRYQELAADYAKSVLQALTDVETALTQEKFDADQEALEAEAVRTAQRSADIARAQLAAGTVDIVTVLNTETTLFNDQNTLAQVRVSRFLALVSLYKALGGGWSLPEHAA